MLITKNQDSDALTGMEYAFSDLMNRFPLAGYAVLGEAVQVLQEEGCGTAATDGRKIIYDPEFWRGLSADDRTFILLHEFLHVFYGHVGRRGQRNPLRWNIAIDIYVNAETEVILGIDIPSYGIQPPSSYKHGTQTVEEIYEELPGEEEALKEMLPADGLEGFGDSTDLLDGTPLSESEKKEWIDGFRKDLARANELHKQSAHGKSLPRSIAGRLEKVMRGTVPYDRLLRGTVSRLLGEDQANWARPNKRMIHTRTRPGMRPVILPTYQAQVESVLLVLVDVSASVRQERLNRFASNIENAAHRAEKTVVVCFDDQIRERYETTSPASIIRNIKLLTGAHGHTCARDAFAVADEIKASAIVCLTDGMIALPHNPYPHTIFVRPPPPEGRALPWGKEFVMETLF